MIERSQQIIGGPIEISELHQRESPEAFKELYLTYLKERHEAIRENQEQAERSPSLRISRLPDVRVNSNSRNLSRVQNEEPSLMIPSTLASRQVKNSSFIQNSGEQEEHSNQLVKKDLLHRSCQKKKTQMNTREEKEKGSKNQPKVNQSLIKKGSLRRAEQIPEDKNLSDKQSKKDRKREKKEENKYEEDKLEEQDEDRDEEHEKTRKTKCKRSPKKSKKLNAEENVNLESIVQKEQEKEKSLSNQDSNKSQDVNRHGQVIEQIQDENAEEESKGVEDEEDENQKEDDSFNKLFEDSEKNEGEENPLFNNWDGQGDSSFSKK